PGRSRWPWSRRDRWTPGCRARWRSRGLRRRYRGTSRRNVPRGDLGNDIRRGWGRFDGRTLGPWCDAPGRSRSLWWGLGWDGGGDYRGGRWEGRGKGRGLSHFRDWWQWRPNVRRWGRVYRWSRYRNRRSTR